MIAHQGKFAEGLDWWNTAWPSDPWAQNGVHNHAIMIHATQLIADGAVDPAEFVRARRAEVETSLQTWLNDVLIPQSP